jgi:hypothetical protein
MLPDSRIVELMEQFCQPNSTPLYQLLRQVEREALAMHGFAENENEQPASQSLDDVTQTGVYPCTPAETNAPIWASPVLPVSSIWNITQSGCYRLPSGSVVRCTMDAGRTTYDVFLRNQIIGQGLVKDGGYCWWQPPSGGASPLPLERVTAEELDDLCSRGTLA